MAAAQAPYSAAQGPNHDLRHLCSGFSVLCPLTKMAKATFATPVQRIWGQSQHLRRRYSGFRGEWGCTGTVFCCTGAIFGANITICDTCAADLVFCVTHEDGQNSICDACAADLVPKASIYDACAADLGRYGGCTGTIFCCTGAIFGAKITKGDTCAADLVFCVTHKDGQNSICDA